MTSRWQSCLTLCVSMLALAMLLPGCPSRKQSSKNSTNSKEPAVAARQGSVIKGRKGWVKSTWVDAVRRNPDALLALFKTLPAKDAEAFRDLLALLKGKTRRALLRPDKHDANRSDMARHLRARLHLRRARYFQQGYQFSMLLSDRVYSQRSALATQLKLGRLFRYYYGRLLCLQGKEKKAQAQLKQALTQSPAKVHARIRLWSQLCTETRAEKVSAALAALDLSKDPDGWAEAQFLAWRANVTLKKPLPAPTPRAALFAAARKGTSFQPKASTLRDPAETEEIKEGEFKGELKFYDPAMMLVLSHHHASRAVSWLKGLKKPSGLSPVLLAEAHLLRGAKDKANALLRSLLAKPPAKVETTTLLFSRHLSKEDVVAHARYLLARSLPKKEAETMRAQLSKEGLPSALLAGLLSTSQTSSARVALLEHSFAWIQREVKAYRKTLRDMSDKKDKGAMLLQQNSLASFLLRYVTTSASKGAVRSQKSYLAVRWMETLHHKATPYKIGGRNQAAQIVQTAMAYTLAGKMGVATEFCLKNRDLYPALNQHWALLGTLRILRGMGGGTVKGI